MQEQGTRAAKNQERLVSGRTTAGAANGKDTFEQRRANMTACSLTDAHPGFMLSFALISAV